MGIEFIRDETDPIQVGLFRFRYGSDVVVQVRESNKGHGSGKRTVIIGENIDPSVFCLSACVEKTTLILDCCTDGLKRYMEIRGRPDEVGLFLSNTTTLSGKGRDLEKEIFNPLGYHLRETRDVPSRNYKFHVFARKD